MALLRGSDLTQILMQADGEDEDDTWENARRARRRALDPNRFPKVPSDKGRELMDSGVFGHPSETPAAAGGRGKDKGANVSHRKAVARRVLDRELGIGDGAFRRMNQALMAQVGFSNPSTGSEDCGQMLTVSRSR